MKLIVLVLPVIFSLTAASQTVQQQSNGVTQTTTVNSAIYPQMFPGATVGAQINAACAAVIAQGGGIIDARGCTGVAPGLQPEIDCGSEAQVAAHIGLTLLLPTSAVWTWALTDGVSCGIRQYGSTSIIGDQPGAGGNRMLLQTGPGAKMDALFCTDGTPTTGGSYVRADGFAAQNVGNGVLVNGVMDIRLLYDEGHFSHIFASNNVGDVWHVQGCCGSSLDHIHGISAATAQGGYPLVLGTAGQNTTSMSIRDSTFNHPGIGKSDVLVAGGGYTDGNTFENLYMEGNGNVDPITPMFSNTGENISVTGGMANTEGAQSATKPVFTNTGYHFNVANYAVNNTALCVNDIALGTIVPCSPGNTPNQWGLDVYHGGYNNTANSK